VYKYWKPLCLNNGRRLYYRDDLFKHTPENKERLKKGRAPIGKDQKPISLHHMTQSHYAHPLDSSNRTLGTLAVVTDTFHKKHDKIIHNILPPNKVERVNRQRFGKERKEIWQDIFALMFEAKNAIKPFVRKPSIVKV
jgi:hypothetical protein